MKPCSEKIICIVAALCVSSISSSLAAEEHPVLTPMHDAVVRYQFQTGIIPSNGVQQHQVTVSFAASGDRLRIDPDDKRGATILDRPAQRMTLVSMADRTYAQFMPMHGLRNPFFLDIGMTYHAKEMSKIAGVSCRNWDIESGHGKAQACVTDDGLILSEHGVDADGISGSLTALAVQYHDIPASVFEPPVGFRRYTPFPVAREQEPSPLPNNKGTH